MIDSAKYNDKAIYNMVNNHQKDKSQKKIYNFDRLKMYRGRPYSIQIPDKYKEIFTRPVTIYIPTIKDIIDYDENDGESKFYGQLLNPLISHTTQYRLKLWQNGIDQNNITDYELFCSLIKSLEDLDTTVLFGDLDFSLFHAYQYPLSEEDIQENELHMDEKNYIPKRPEIILVNEEQLVIIDESVYNIMAEYLRTMFNIFPKVEKAKGKSTKQALIDEDEFNLNNHVDDESSSFLLPLISACVNHPGFKYKASELDEVNIVEFMDSVKRLQIYESTVALNRGMYSGFCDVSKVDKKLFNFMREINE